MDVKFFVITNNAEHSGHVVSEDMDKIWPLDDGSGWTYQDLTGPFGRVWGEYDTEAEANAELDDYLKCDAAENGRYCYTHNKI